MRHRKKYLNESKKVSKWSFAAKLLSYSKFKMFRKKHASQNLAPESPETEQDTDFDTGHFRTLSDFSRWKWVKLQRALYDKQPHSYSSKLLPLWKETIKVVHEKELLQVISDL